jgi:hypothetical protein
VGDNLSYFNTISITGAGTSAVTSVAYSATNATLLASTPTRKQAMFYNNATKACYLKLGITASAASFTIQLNPNGYYELPSPCYTGRIDAIWEAGGAGAMLITELT